MKRILVLLFLAACLLASACTAPQLSDEEILARAYMILLEKKGDKALLEEPGKENDNTFIIDDEDIDVDEDKPASPPADTTNILEKLTTTEYTYFTDYSNYGILTIKNNSDINLQVDITATFYDANDSIIGTSSNAEFAFEAGYELGFVFSNDDKFARVEYEIDAQEETYYQAVMSSLSLDVSTTDKKAIISVTNTSDKPVEFVEYFAIFLKGDQVVSFDWGFCTDSDNQLKPGKTIRKEADTYESFDTVKVFITGNGERL